ncbi:transcription elongation factor [Cryptosporidium ryanae]|uniref:transcription elongation factor n=1 Tax=Cryptosporidium ryanae TaxID=515981 RepID=UPI00351A7BF1|nr:transcription elongation factor [Cryptosporidium ryanae]
MEKEEHNDAKTNEDKQNASPISEEVDTSINTKSNAKVLESSTVTPAAIVTEIDKEGQETDKVVDFIGYENPTNKALYEANIVLTDTGKKDKLNDHRAQEPKKKKRRQSGSQGSSLHTLLHGNIPNVEGSNDENGGDKNVDFGLSSHNENVSDIKITENDNNVSKRSKSLKVLSSKSKKKKFHYRHENIFINNEADETDEYDDHTDVKNTKSSEYKGGLKRKTKLHLSNDDEDDDEEDDEDDEDGYEELKDFITDEIDDGIDDQGVYNEANFGNFNNITSTEKGDGHLLGSGDVNNDDDEDDDDDEILRGDLEEDDLELIEENTGIRLRKDTHSQKHRLRRVSEADGTSSGKTLVGKDIGDLEDLLFSGETGGDDLENFNTEDNRLNNDLDNDEIYDEDDDDDGWMVYDTEEKSYKGDEYSMIQSVFGDYDTVMDILMNKFHKYKSSDRDDDETHLIEANTGISRSNNIVDLANKKSNKQYYKLDEEDEALFEAPGDEKDEELELLQEGVKKTTLHTLQSISEPSEIERQYITDFDTEVREVDAPERLYLLYSERWKSLSGKKIVKEELQIESNWITKKFLQTYPELFKEDYIRRIHTLEFKSSFPYSYGGGSIFKIVSSAVLNVLDWILNERLDIPYISLHKFHLVHPPLNEFLIGKILYLDSVYCNLKFSMESLHYKLISQRNSKILDKYSNISEVNENFDNEEFISAFLAVSGLNEILSMKSFDSNRDIDQLRLYLTYHIETQRFRQITNMDNEGELRNNITEFCNDSGRKQRKSFLAGLFEYIENNKVYDVWNQYIVSPYVLSLYMKNFSSPQFHCSVPASSSHKLPSTFSLLPPAGPAIENSKSALNKWFEKYIIPESPHFLSSEKMIESLIIYEAKRLATFPIIRAKIYDYFFCNACITTVTTVKGERSLIPNNTAWLAGRIFRKPINTLFPGTYLPLNDDNNDSNSNFNALFDGCLSSQIFELEKQGLINVIIHPLYFDDEAPWRGSDGEARIKERFLHQVSMFKTELNSYNNSNFDFGKNLENTVHLKTNAPIPTPIQNRFDQEMRMFRNSDNIDNRIVRNILDELKYGYVSVSGNIWSKQIQVPILHRLIEKELFPAFRRDVLNYMKLRSQEYIAELCYLSLQKRLRLLPPKRPTKLDSSSKDNLKTSGLDLDNKSNSNFDKDDENDDFDEYEYGFNNLGFRGTFANGRFLSNQKMRDQNLLQSKEEYNTSWGLNVISCVIERAKNGFKICVVALDIFGELRDYLMLNHLLIPGSSIHKFSNMLNNNNPDKGDASGSVETQRFEEDLENLVKFTKTYFPHYICIGVSDMKSLELGTLWGDVVLKRVKRKDKDYIPGIYFVCMDVSKALVRKLNSESATRKEHEGYPIPVEMAISVGRLVQNPLAEQLRLWDDGCNEIERELGVNLTAKSEFSRFSKSTIRNSGNSFYSQVSSGGSGFNSITCLKLHRYQDSVDNKLLQFHLLMAIRSVVSNMGVQINRMKGHQHLQSPLKFVSGLGPRKARLLGFYVDSISEPILNRSKLKNESNVLSDGRNNSSSSINSGLKGKKNRDNYHNSQYDDEDDYQSDIEKKNTGCLTENVYLNSEVFLRVDEESLYEKEFNKNLNIFDISRLSDICDTEFVTTILGNIKDVASDEGTNSAGGSSGRQKCASKEVDNSLYWSWISKRENKLETLDLEAYAKLMYESQNIPRLLPYLNRMLAELKKPYDCTYFAKEIRGMDRYRQVKEAMQISKEDLFIGSEITCRVTGVVTVKPGGSFPRNPVLFWFDQYSMKVLVDDFENFWDELMDEHPLLQSVPLASIFKVNTPLQATVTNIDFVQNCVFVSLSQGKICSTLNYLIETVWRQQQVRSEKIEKDNSNISEADSLNTTSGSVYGSTSVSTPSFEEVSEFRRNNFNILQDDLSSLIWTDIRHYAYILFKKNLNVISNCSKAELSSLGGGSDFKDGAAGRYLRGGTIHRTIHHPNYKTWNHEEVLNYMKDENIPIGEVVIKSSNRYIDKLIMYVKVCSSPFMVKIFNIDEFDQRLPGELGRRLKIDDSEFNDIDQILIQYVHPLRVHLSTVYTHNKYRANMEYQNLVSELLVESTRSGNSIVWGIVADKQIPCRFHLISVPPNTRMGSSGARIHFEDGIYVTQRGFQLWRKSESTLRKLLNWWKTEGFFKRAHYLDDYKRYKESMVREKQGIKGSALHSKRFGPGSNHYYNQHGTVDSSGYGSSGHGGGFYQNQRYAHDNHGHYSNRGYGHNMTNEVHGTNYGGATAGNAGRNYYRRQ